MSESTATTPISAAGGSDDGRRPIRRALLSVYDKAGLVELAQALTEAGVAIVSTGSTAATMAAAGVPVTPVEDLTGFPETLGGRVKTLHPKVHGGLLADQNNPEHVAQLADLGIESFDLLVSNLYPFTDTVASGAGADECIEQIDIGGPAMVRASAKNHASMAVLTSPAQYAGVLDALRSGGFTLAQRQRLAAEAFVHTATYDVNVASWLGNVVTDTSDGAGFPAWVGATWNRKAVLRYGENPHQRAAVYESGYVPVPGLAQAVQLHGKEMSYNNYVDADSARRTALGFDDPAVAIIKHANPCGIAVIAGGRRRVDRSRTREGARLRSRVGVRRGDRDQPSGHGEAGRADRPDLHRGRRGPVVRAGRAGDPHEEEEPPAPDGACGRARRRRDAGDLRRHADADRRCPGRRRRRPGERGRWPPATRSIRPGWTICCSPGGPAAP